MSEILQIDASRLDRSGQPQHPPAVQPVTVSLVTSIWEQLLDRSPIGLDENFFDLGGDSLRALRFCAELEDITGRQIPVTLVFEAPTIARLTAEIAKQDRQRVLSAHSPLVPIQAHGSKPPLFLCQGVGIYYPLARHLGDSQPVYGLVTETVAEFSTLEEIASFYLNFVMKTQPKGPYFLGGMSFGGIVALEMAQQLRAMGHGVGLLALMDTPGPGAYRLKPPARRALGHAKNLMRYGLPYLRLKIENGIGRLRPAMPFGAARTPIANIEQWRVELKRRVQMYQPRPYDGPVTLFVLAHRDAMSNSLFDPELCDVDPSLGWGSIAAGGLARYELAGDHLSILKEPFVQALGERLKACLDTGP